MKNYTTSNGGIRTLAHFRYLVAAAGFLTTLCLGTLYAWAIFMPSLEAEFGWSRAAVTIPFTVAGLVFAFGMVPAGRILDLKGPRLLLIASAVLAIVGYGLSSAIHSLWQLVITFGIIMGVAIATGYCAAVAGGIKWFPDMKGTATGILVGGFGAAAAVFGPLSHFIVAEYGWRSAFLILGAIFAALIGLCSFIIVNPLKGWRPAGWDPTKTTGIRKRSPEYTGYEFPFKKMLRTRQFWFMWTHYVLILAGGFSVIVHLHPLALGLGFTAAAAAGLVAIIALSNLSGRFILSPLSDVIGRLKSFTIIGSLMAIATASAALASIFGIPNLLYFSAIIGGVSFGGYLALSPAFTADMWGMKNFGANYGGMFTGWGVASFVGPFFAGLAFDVFATYNHIFLVFAALSILAVLIAKLFVKPAALKARAIELGVGKAELA